jgi:hypothetical protein
VDLAAKALVGQCPSFLANRQAVSAQTSLTVLVLSTRFGNWAPVTSRAKGHIE